MGGLGLFLTDLSSAVRSRGFALADAKPCCLQRTFHRGLLIVGSHFLGTQPATLVSQLGLRLSGALL